MFEIDTTCTFPANHLLFIGTGPPLATISPSFTKGIITIQSPETLAWWPGCGCPGTMAMEDTITSPFGARGSNGSYQYHDAIDIRNRYNEPVHAIFSGRIHHRELQPGFGWWLEIDSDVADVSGESFKLRHLYHHMQEPSLDKGDQVTRGQVIGYSASGLEVPTHIHLETMPDANDNKRSHPARYFQRAEISCPGFALDFDTLNTSDHRYTLSPAQGPKDYLLARSQSPIDERYDLIALSVTVYSAVALPPSRTATIHFENDYPNWKAAGSLNQKTRTFFPGELHEVTITLEPRDMPAGAPYHEIDIKVDPLYNFTSIDWLGISLQDISALTCSEVGCGIPQSAAAGGQAVCPWIGNVTGETPGLLLDFFNGRIIEDGFEVSWKLSVGSRAITSELHRAVGNGPLELIYSAPLMQDGLPLMDTLRFLDQSAQTDGPLKYRIASVFPNGSKVFFDDSVERIGDQSGSPQPRSFALAQNAPNPFNSATLISFEIAGQSQHRMSLTIYDVLGRRIRTLIDADATTPGTYSMPWDGRDADGSVVASGVYLYELIAGGNRSARKMVVLR
ncbi:MAG: peptidoglycan DD-metalloendopeptidase family protein [Candidatus Zixiibacteriota bacterium]